MNKILFIVTELESANGICAINVMEEYVNNGYEVFCLTNLEPNKPKTEVYRNIQIIRVRPCLSYTLNKMSRNKKGLNKKILLFSSLVLSKLKLVIMLPFWPMTSFSLSIRYFLNTNKLVREKKIVTIVCVYTQIDTLISGYLSKLINPSIRFIPYFLDSLSGGPGLRIFSSKYTIRVGLFWEKILLSKADKIVMMEASFEHHKRYSSNRSYYNKMVFLDLPLYKPLPIRNIKNDAIPKKSTEFLFVGTIPCKIRNPEFMLKVFSTLINYDIRLTIVGTNTCPELFREYQKIMGEKLVLLDFIGHSDAIRLMLDADVLVNIGNNIVNMVPSKIFEYMSLKKPILSFCSLTNDSTFKYLNAYPLKLILMNRDNDVLELKNEILAFINQIKIPQLVKFNDYNLVNNTPEKFFLEIQ